MEENILLKIGEIESSIKSAHKRIDGLEKLTNSVYELASSIKVMQSDLRDISSRIKSVEETPKKRWEHFVTALITSLAGLIMGYLWGLLK